MTKSTENQNAEVAAETTENQTAAAETKQTMVMPVEGVFANIGEMLNNSELLETAEPTVSLIPEYYEFLKPGDAIRGIYLGITESSYNDNTGTPELKKSVQWISNRKIYFNSGWKLVNGVEKSGIKTGTPIEITFTGKTGQAKDYSVSLLK